MRRVTFDLLFVAVLAAIAGFVFSSATGLPAVVATHFPRTDRASGLMARESYAQLMTLLALGVPLFVFIGGALLPRWLPRFGFGPYAGYWLAPERQAATLAAVRHHAEGVAIIAALFVGGLHASILQANQTSPPQFHGPTIGLIFGGFFLLIGAAIVAWHRRFRHPR